MRVARAQSDNVCHHCRGDIPKGTPQVVVMLNFTRLCTYHPKCRAEMLKNVRRVNDCVQERTERVAGANEIDS